jgi:hypothetical protein
MSTVERPSLMEGILDVARPAAIGQTPHRIAGGYLKLRDIPAPPP